jgi:hypothetical protein
MASIIVIGERLLTRAIFLIDLLLIAAVAANRSSPPHSLPPIALEEEEEPLPKRLYARSVLACTVVL